ncbi:pentatricopeptide repeat-containing protein At1g71490 [Cryptomeria japonica]|uniref:pentatricopeptide repeat-containing protein At1g71490 n=1 Tax=Cryptomeria japonica TaxID=3369 RepID=UPI0027DA9E24|nr:pentatricopeptide repeat-containing protein At1g71490 [Cryptomeria japonica]
MCSMIVYQKSAKLIFLRFIHGGVRTLSSMDSYNYFSLLQTCANMKNHQQGKKIHAHLILTGNEFDMYIQTKLVAMYANCGSLMDARKVFDKVPQPNLFLWNLIIAQYVLHGRFGEAIWLYHEMLRAGLEPDNYTIPPILKACAQLTALREGMEIHDYITRNKLDVNEFVENALVDMYAKCGRLGEARQLFDKMSKGDVVSWNAMIGGYAQNGHCDEAMSLFEKMQAMGVAPELVTWNAIIAGHTQNNNANGALKLLRKMIVADFKPDSVTAASVLPACARLGTLQYGKEIHGYAIRNGLESNAIVQNALIDVYAKCGSSNNAYHMFHTVTYKTVVSWNAIIAGYAQSGYYEESLDFFRQMQLAAMKPNNVTLASVLPVISHLSNLQQGKEIHAYILRIGFESFIIVMNALVDMYNKCGSTRLARQVFDRMPKRDVFSWTAMIAGYGMQGKGDDAVILFSQMLMSGMKPDDVSFLAILSACSHSGLVVEGRKYFDMMREHYGINPRMEHYACMVDLLGRAGCLDEAEEFIKKMPMQPNIAVWATLLGACRIHSAIELGERVAECIFKLKPENPGYYVLMCNIYGAAGRWDDQAKVRKRMREDGLQKNPGWSRIEVRNQIHAFHVGDLEWLYA